jgi:putative glutamine amidotransferase
MNKEKGGKMTRTRKQVIIVTAGYYTDIRPYASAIADAGGVPIVLLPSQVEVHLESYVDGVVLPRGKDVHPHRYGHNVDPEIDGTVDKPRDHLEFAILQLAIERGLPVLDICRGLQLINIFYRGTLHLNMPSHKIFQNTVHHRKHARDFLAHKITAGSHRLQGILGSNSFQVNSIHKQGIVSLGVSICSTITAEDSLVEGVESVDGQVLGIQWHPEELAPTQSQSAALFIDLVSRAGARSQLSRQV